MEQSEKKGVPAGAGTPDKKKSTEDDFIQDELEDRLGVLGSAAGAILCVLAIMALISFFSR